jgi:hypothetical protein
MIRIKFLSNSVNPASTSAWRRQLPDTAPTWGKCEFVFDPMARHYDWLVVYDRFPSVAGERFSMWREELACPPENTLFITVEPSSIKSYEPTFLAQFGYVLTGHEPWSIDGHPAIIRSQPALRWFYGCGGERLKTLDHLRAESPLTKAQSISTVCSTKKQNHTLHRKRHEFTKKLKKAIPHLNIYGRGVKPIRDKAEAIDSYRYHIAIENHRCDHHWTEKISDAFLGWSLPLYYGCTNLRDYFPEESFIEIDINDFDDTVGLIQNLLLSDEYEKRLPAILKARDLVLNKYNLFAVVARLAEEGGALEPNHSGLNAIYSRHALRKASIKQMISYGIQSIHRQLRARINF